MFDLKYRRAVKKAYIVHPSAFLTLLVKFCKAFLISQKAGLKIRMCASLRELSTYLPVATMKIPNAVKRWDVMEVQARRDPRLQRKDRSDADFDVNFGRQRALMLSCGFRQDRHNLWALKQTDGCLREACELLIAYYLRPTSSAGSAQYVTYAR